MYRITNAAEISDVMESKMPRPAREVILEMYPECTIDEYDRAHAPYDGYVCDITGRVFRGGEYLPLNEETLSSTRNLYVFDVTANEALVFSGTKKMIDAGKDIAKKQNRKLDLYSDHIAPEYSRTEFQLTCFNLWSEEGAYGMEHSHTFYDHKGNKIYYTGSKIIAQELESVRINATIKRNHLSKAGIKTTIINRPKILTTLSKPKTEKIKKNKQIVDTPEQLVLFA